MQSSNWYATTTLAILLGACLPVDEVYEDFQKYADAGTTTGVEDSADASDASDPSTTGDPDPDDDAGTTLGAPSDLPPETADELPEILSFTVEPPVIDEAGPVTIDATFSESIATAALFEKRDGKTHLLKVLEPASALTYEYAVTSDNLNGEHELYLQAFDAEDRVVQATSNFDVALPPGGTPVWHHVDYDPDDSALLTYGADVAVHGDGFVVVGVRIAENQFHLITRRYTGDGELEWAFESEDEVSGEAVAVDDEGNIVVAGIEYGAKPRMWVHKLDAQGAPLWGEPERGMPDTMGFDVAVDSSEQIYVVGTRTMFDPDDDLLYEDDAILWEYTPDGAMMAWADYDNDTPYFWGNDRAKGVAVLSDGRVMLAGETVAADENNEMITQAMVLEYEQHQLARVWPNEGQQTLESSASSIAAGTSSGFAIAGWTRTSQQEPKRLAVLGFDEPKSNTWAYPGYPTANSIGEAYAIARDPEGRFAVGASVAGDYGLDARAFVSGVEGEPSWPSPFTYNGSENGDENVYGVATDSFGYIYFTGSEIVDGKPRLMLGKLRP